MTRSAAFLLVLALAVGALLRFAELGARDLSADEGASWAAAAAPTLRGAIASGAAHNPGKVPFHDVLLHGWIAAFGDGVAPMRAMSALFGTLAILLGFFAMRELMRSRVGDVLAPGEEAARGVAVLGALLLAVNLVTIKYSREARMYSMTLAGALAQVGLFLRVLRVGRAADYAGVALLTAATLAANTAAALLLVPEAIWLLYLVTRPAPRIGSRPRAGSPWLTGAAIAFGLALLTPALYVSLSYGRRALEAGKWNWLKLPPPWAPLSLFTKATGSAAFPVMAALALLGIWRGWRGAKAAIAFALLWMWAPIIVMTLASYVWHPMFLERYAIYCFPAFFILTALGVWELGSNRARTAGATLAVALALGHIYSYSRKPHGPRWLAAAQAAAASLKPGETVAVMPPYAVEVVRYYLPRAARPLVVPSIGHAQDSPVVILREHGVSRQAAADLSRDYPRVVAHPWGVIVRAR